MTQPNIGGHPVGKKNKSGGECGFPYKGYR